MDRSTNAAIPPKQWPRALASFVCQNCGAASNRWQGKCEACGEWNTLVEETAGGAACRTACGEAQGARLRAGELTGDAHDAPRIPSGIAELDRVTGGGFVARLGAADRRRSRHRQVDAADPGRAVLARAGRSRRLYLGRGGGGPGAAARRAARACRCAGAARRARPRSRTSSRRCRQGDTAALVVIDSIQTMWTDTVDSAPGTVTQVRASAQALIRFAKTTRRGAHPGRPRHQGRPDRRPARGRAHGRRRAVVRGRRLAPVPHPARRQEPLRRRPTRSACSR